MKYKTSIIVCKTVERIAYLICGTVILIRVLDFIMKIGYIAYLLSQNISSVTGG